jgi:hypothetical protein
VDKENRTVPVVFATDTPVLTRNWRIDDGKPFYEILSFDKGHVRTGRLEKGLGVFKDHYTSTDNQIGTAENYTITKTDASAVVRFSENEEEFFSDVAANIKNKISVGFNVYRYEDITPEGETTRTLRAIDWEPMEISFVGVPADVNSGTRSNEEELHEVEIEISQKRSLTDNPKNPIMEKTAAEKEAIKTRNAEIRQRKLEEAQEKGRKEFQKLTVDVTEICRKAGVSEDVTAEILKTENITIEKARALVLDKVIEGKSDKSTNPAGGANVKVGTEQTEKVSRALGDALILRVDPTAEKSDLKPEQVEVAKIFRGLNFVETGRKYMEMQGVKTDGMTKREIFNMLFDPSNRAMAIGDFSTLLGATFNRTLRRAYEMTAPTFEPFVRRATIPDFRSVSRVQLSGLVGAFDAIAEGGEYKEAKFTEGKETYSLLKYGKKVAFTFESFVNDDLDAFRRAPMAIANKAQQKKSDIVYEILSGNPAMGDTYNLFSSEHANLGSAGAPSETTLNAARKAMRIQKDPNGDFINVTGKFLLTGPNYETIAQKVLRGDIKATKTDDTNVFKGSLEQIVEPRITDNAWYVIADPGMIDTIETAYLEGEPDLFTETRIGFDVDGMEMKARMFFAAKAIDHRGMYKFPNA